MSAPRLAAVIFDWAGTMVDFGSRAPMGVFVEVFRRFGVAITVAQARGPMGLPKRPHIQALLDDREIAEAWRAAHGHAPTDADVDAIYEIFVPMNAEVVAVGDHADLVPGAAAVVEALRGRGLKIGSTTGYTRDIMERLLPVAAAQGFAPDCLVCAGDVAAGRPTPLMMYRCFLDLQVWPAAACVKVDDTEPGIAEGLAAGSWTVGVAVSGNAVGLSRDEWSALPPADQAGLRARATDRLRAAGTHMVIDTVADLEPCLDAIERRLAAGERP